MYRPLASSCLALTAAAACILLDPAPAHAQAACASDADCPQGFVCEVVGSSACPDAPPCAPGEDCPEPEPCVPEEWTECVPGPCTSDADCAPGLKCLTFTSTECTDTDVAAPACEPGTECIAPPAPSPSDCVDTTESICAPAWVGPCEVDADCGEGFQCVPEEICWCEGGGAVPDPDSTEPVPPPEEVCGCEPTGEMRCEAQQMVCTSDVDCPTDWTCVSDQAEICTASSEGGEPVCEPVSMEAYCMPPYWALVTGSDAGAGGEVYESTPAATPEPQDPNAAPRALDEGGEMEGGCSVTGSSPGSTSAWLLLGLVGLLGRRRQRR